ncbi:MAG TPA: VWA domain-containing protein [Terriglobales bacterium]|nr:VWA domain-containing protein [Terriglobales bacterium]
MHRQSTALLCSVLGLVWLLPAQQAVKKPAPSKAPAKYLFKATTNIVLVNLTVRDAHGNLVTNLKPSEVTLLEDGKPQHISSFDFEDVDAEPGNLAAAAAAGPSGIVEKAAAQPAAAPPAPAKAATAIAPAAASQYRDRRLMVMYFDLTTMQPEDVQNVMQQATTYVQKKMQPADLVAIATLGDSLQVDQDFTANKAALLGTLKALNPSTSAGFEDGTTGSTDGTADDGSTFAADDTEFNIANADRSLEALQSVCDMLSGIQQKKSLLYFTSGIQRSGVDNEITLRSAVNSCVKANAAIYSVDARGLQAMVPGGDASGGSIRGAGAFNGGAQRSTLDAQFAQQETISTLANDTGGKSFLDSNDFAPVYAKVQADTSSYYLLGYTSTNPAQNGKYRHIVIKISRPGLKLSFRPGYYAPRDINHLNTADRQQQLQDELNADVSDHSLDLYLADGYLRLNRFRYYVPVSITIPGNEIPLHGVNPKATPEVDIAGEVIDQSGRKLDHVLQTIKLTPQVAGPGQQLQNRNLQYSTGFLLAPGQKYQIRFAARENQTGQMGAFETILSVPDLDAQAAKSPHVLTISSVLVGSQLVPVRPNFIDPLTESGHALVVSVNHVFANNQHMYLYFEVYDPKVTAGKSGDAIKLLSNVAFYRGRVKAFESQLLSTERITDPARGAAVIQIDIPLAQLKPGYYLCQVNAVDDNAARFAFPRVPILIRPAQSAPAASPTNPTP